jgi:hypothetical protein
VPTILLLIASNIFMTVAWYWHLKGGMTKPLFVVILVSWALALVEYCFAVPANRVGYANGWTAAQLKIVQEAIAIAVFAVFMVIYLGEPLHWRQAAAFICIIAAVAFLFVGKHTRHSLYQARPKAAASAWISPAVLVWASKAYDALAGGYARGVRDGSSSAEEVEDQLRAGLAA